MPRKPKRAPVTLELPAYNDPKKRTNASERLKMTGIEVEARRAHAELFYVNDWEGRLTLNVMAAMPEFSDIPIGVLEHWCSDNKWPHKRRLRQDELRRALESNLNTKIVSYHSAQLEKMNRLYDKVMAFVLSDAHPEARSFEGCINAALKIADHIRTSSESIVQKVLPPVAAKTLSEDEQPKQGNIPPEVLPPLSSEEALMLAHTLIKHRQTEEAHAMVHAEDDEVIDEPPGPDGLV